jgi:hypothetical protein
MTVNTFIDIMEKRYYSPVKPNCNEAIGGRLWKKDGLGTRGAEDLAEEGSLDADAREI